MKSLACPSAVQPQPTGLWTKSFTTITLGSAVSLLGNALVSFALSLFVLDLTNAPALYALYLFLNTLPQLETPLVAGPLLDRVSRRRAVYLLDFASAALYLGAGVFLSLYDGTFALLAVVTLLSGAINSVYQVAFNSLYPLLIPPGNVTRAYSVASILQTLSYVMVAVAAVLYRAVGIAPLLLVTGLCFLVAALFETRIDDVEADLRQPVAEKGLTSLRKGLRYLLQERGLLWSTANFAVCSFVWGAASALALPWFLATQPNGERAYMSVWVFMVIGKVLGGLVQYRWRLPTRWKYLIALICCTGGVLAEGLYLFAPLRVMGLLCFLIGVCNGCAQNIRTSATQSYVRTGFQGRFNASVVLLSTGGRLLGELCAGGAVSVMSTRSAMGLLVCTAGLAAAALLLWGRRTVAPLYNRET